MDWLAKANEKRALLIERTASLVAFNTIEDPVTADPVQGAPYGQNLKEALDFALKMGEEAGFETANLEGHAGRIATGSSRKIFGILAHLDTVPVGEGWLTDPFTLVKKDGRLHGRGVIDNKGPVAAALTAMEIARSLVDQPVADIHLIMGCNEETGMACMNHYLKHSEILPDFGVTPDNAFPVIFGEKGIIRVTVKGPVAGVIQSFDSGTRPNVVPGLAKATLSMAGKSQAEIQASFDDFLVAFDLTGLLEFASDGNLLAVIHGLECHSQEPADGINAAVFLFRWISRCFGDPQASHLAATMGDRDGEGAGIRFEGKFMKELTMSLGLAKIGNGQLSLTIDIRHPNDIAPEEILERMAGRITGLEPEWKVELASVTPPLFVDPSTDFIQKLAGIYRSITGDQDSPLGITGGGTYARMFDKHVAFGPLYPTDPDPLPEGVGSLHQPNEAYGEDQLVELCAIYANLIHGVMTGEIDF